MTHPDSASTRPGRKDDAAAMIRRYAAKQRRRRAIAPGLVCGLGGVWLAFALTRDTRIAQQLGLSRRMDSLRHAGDAVGSRLVNAAGGARTRVVDLGATASQRLGEFQERAQVKAGTARRWSHDAFTAEPLAVAAFGVAIGAAVAALWPASGTERRLIGGVGGRLMAEARTRLGDVEGAAVEALRTAEGVLNGTETEEERAGDDRSGPGPETESFAPPGP